MAPKNILALSVLLYFSSYYTIEGEIIRGMEIPKLNITGILGKWYLLGTTNKNDQFACMNIFIKQRSEKKITMDIEWTLMNAWKRKLTMRHFKPDRCIQMYATKENDSSKIIFVQSPKVESGLVIFDVAYDSYMVWYFADIDNSLEHATDGFIFIFSREKMLSDNIFNKVENSTFYTQGLNPANKLLRVNARPC